MKKISTLLLCLLAASMAHSETTGTPAPPVPATRPATAIAPKAITPLATPTATKAFPAVTPAGKPATAIIPSVAEVIATPAPEVTLEQRRQQELLIDAQRIDKANHELLAKNQDLQLQIENLALQNNVLKRDRSSEGIWKGALAVITGFLMGWYFSGGGRRKSSW